MPFREKMPPLFFALKNEQFKTETTLLAAMKTVRFNLTPTAPFQLGLTAWVLRRATANRIDYWNGKTYRRAMTLDSQTVLVSVEQMTPPGRPELEVTLVCENPSSGTSLEAESALVRILGLNTDLEGFYSAAEADGDLGPLVERFRGVKPTRLPTLFESIANAVVFQQLSLNSAMSILNRLAETYGVPFDCGENACPVFPEARSLARLQAEQAKTVGLSANKARALVEGARIIIEQNLSIDDFETMDNESAVAELVKFRGIGRWSADYVLLRGLGRLDVFPRGDVGARASLNRWLKPGDKLSDSELEDKMTKWRGYAGLVYFHLLLRRLEEKGFIP
jgi:DNA-3-methyladenine glycosylase II